jgi:HSP20 family protein
METIMTVQPTDKHFLPTLQRSATGVFAPIQREFDRLFDQLGASWVGAADVDLTTRMDVRDTDKGLEITLEAPGVDQKDVKISVEDNVLTVSGEKKSESEKKGADYRVSERAYGAFSRSIGLPSSVDAEKITASMDRGVLKIVAPKNGKTQAKSIAIQSAK